MVSTAFKTSPLAQVEKREKSELFGARLFAVKAWRLWIFHDFFAPTNGVNKKYTSRLWCGEKWESHGNQHLQGSLGHVFFSLPNQFELVDFPINNGGSFHSFLLTFTRPGKP